MKRILVTGAGGSPSTNFIRSLRKAREKFYIVGTDADKYYLMRAEVDSRYLVPFVNSSLFIPVINKIIKKEKIELIHIQNDTEMKYISRNREKIKTKTFLPSKKTVEICLDKYLSYQKWKKAGIKIPETMIIKNERDLKKAFIKYRGKLWLRATTGAGGRGSLPVKDIKIAKSWINFMNGWGEFTASELLQPDTITWMSIWKNGELIVAQGRKRLYWELGKNSPSGVSGVTGTGMTVSDPILDEIALKAIIAIDNNPNGLFGVDLTYDSRGIPNPTEINIGRFFTTHHFFTVAGVNMPHIFIKMAFDEKMPTIKKKVNPLKPGQLWIRGVDFIPVFTNLKEVEKNNKRLERMVKSVKE